jgi:hypothetical protein
MFGFSDGMIAPSDELGAPSGRMNTLGEIFADVERPEVHIPASLSMQVSGHNQQPA